MTDRVPRALLGLLLLAFALRAATVLAISDPVTPSGDLQYHLYAVSVLDRREYKIEAPDWTGEAVGIFHVDSLRSFKPPLYPFFLASLYALFGRAFLAVGLAQAALGTLTCWVAYRLGTRFFGNRAGLIACAYLSVYPYYVFHGTSIGDTALYTFLLGATVLALSRIPDQLTLDRLVAPGLLLGLAILCRPTSLALLPPIVCWLFLGAGLSRPTALRALVVLGLVTGLAVAPWVVRNSLVHGRLVILGTNGGYTFWQANNGFTRRYLQLRTDLDAITFHEAVRWGERPPTRLTEAEQDAWFYAEALRFLRQHPLEFFRLLWLKLGGFWSPRLYPATDNWAKAVAYSFTYGPLLGLAAMGIWRGRARGPTWLLVGAFASFSLVYAVFYGMTRYRSPLDQFLAVLGGFALDGLWRRVSRHAA